MDRATSRRIEAVSELVWLLLGETSETTPLPMDLSTNQQLVGANKISSHGLGFAIVEFGEC